MSDGKVINFVYSLAYSYLCLCEDTFARWEKYSSKLDIYSLAYSYLCSGVRIYLE